LRRAYLTGQKNVRFELRGQKYEYNFDRMLQVNRATDKQRCIRPPLGPKPPARPLLPAGPMIMITVGTGQAGSIITVKDPNNAGKTIDVFVPAHAREGQKMAVPVPAKGETVAELQKKQKDHEAEHAGKKASSWSTGGRVASGAAAAAGVAGVFVGGVILGDYLAGGDLADTIGEATVDASEAVAEAVTEVAEDAGDWAEDAGIVDWAEDALEDLGDFAEDAGDWLGDAGEDFGDFVMDLF